MRLGGDNDRRIADVESSRDELRHVLKKGALIGIKAYFVVVGRLHALWRGPCHDLIATGIMRGPLILKIAQSGAGQGRADKSFIL